MPYPILHAQCPWCGYQMTVVSDVEGGDVSPKEGDVGLCFGCAEPFMFDAHLVMRTLAPSDVEKLEPETRDILQRVQKLHATMFPPKAKH